MTGVLVTGATGTVGHYVVPRLLAAGVDVVALTRDRGKARRVLGDDVAVLEGDLRRFTDVLDAAPRIDQVVLILSHCQGRLACRCDGC